MSGGMPYTATVTVSYSGSRTLHYSFMGEGGYYAQVGSTNQFTFTPNVSGGPYTNDVLVDDGCQLAWGSLAGIRTPPGDVSGATAVASGQTTITVSWTNPAAANLRQVEVSGAGFTTVDVASPGTSHTLSGLTPGKLYPITLKAMDAYGNRSAGVTVSATTAGGLTAFVSSATYTGNLGGPGGADAECAALALAAGLPGTYVAVLSTTTVNAVDRVTDARYQNTRGQIVGTKAVLSGGGPLTNAIDYDENGNQVDPVEVWAGSSASGQLFSSDYNCSNWTTSSPFLVGEVGVSSSTSSQWLLYEPAYCDQSAPLYCFQL